VIDETNAVLYTTYDYSKHLPPELASDMSINASLLRQNVLEMKKIVRRDLEWQVVPEGRSHAPAADRLEVAAALHWRRLDPNGFLLESMYDGVCRAFLTPVWLEMDPFRIPAQEPREEDDAYEERVQQYRESWFGYRADLKPQKSVYFHEKRGVPTAAALEYKLPVLDLAQRYVRTSQGASPTKDDTKLMLRLFDQYFPRLREGMAHAEDDPEFWSQEATVCVLDDGYKIGHYLDLPKANTDRYQGIKDGETDNPFRRCSLFLAFGRYNHGQPMESRFEPLLLPLIQIEKARSIVKSTWGAMAMQMPRLAEQLHAEVARTIAVNPGMALPDSEFYDEEGNPKVYKALGQLSQLVNEVDPTMDKFFSVLDQERGAATPRSFLNDPQQTQAVARMPATSVLFMADEENGQVSDAVRSITSAIGDINLAIFESFRYLNRHRKNGEKSEADESFYGITTGEERVHGREVKAGQPVEVRPQDLDFPFTLAVKAVDLRPSVQAARRMEADARWFTPDGVKTITFDDRLSASSVTNVSEYKELLTADAVYQFNAAQFIAASRMDAINLIAFRDGRDPAQLAQLVGMAAPMLPNSPAGMAPSAGAPNTVQVLPPGQENTPIEAAQVV